MKALIRCEPACLVLALGLLFGCTGTAGSSPSGRTASGDIPGQPATGSGLGGNSSSNGSGSGGTGSGVGGAGNGSGGASSGSGGGATSNAGSAQGVPGLRRLTHIEYNNTIFDVLQTSLVTVEGELVSSGPASSFQNDTIVDGYDNYRSVLGVTAPLADQYANTAADLAAEAVSSGKLTALASCAGGAEETCVEAFLQSFGQTLYRRPLSAEEVSRHLTLFRTERLRSEYGESVQILLEAMLQSPHFLYRSEYGVPAASGTRVLTDYEIASLLSYLFWSSPPDAALFSAASNGELKTAAARETHARRLLQSGRSWPALNHLLTQWTATGKLLTVSKDAAVYPSFDAAMRQSMVDAQQGFFRGIVGTGDASLTSLVAGDTGMLTQPWLLTVHSRADESFPIARGVFVRRNLLCQDLPPPPKDVVVQPVERNPNATTRERFRAHSTDPACSGCHSLIDPVGFGFERFDGIGQYRTMENGLPVDDAGELTATEDANGPFRGPAELGTRLSASVEVQRCAVRQAFRYALGFREDSAAIANLNPVLNEFQSGGLNVRELLVLLARADLFVTRAAIQ